MSTSRIPPQRKAAPDVYYRLNTFNVMLPPLRERREEIEPLFRQYVKRLAYAYKLPPRPLTDMLLHAVCSTHGRGICANFITSSNATWFWETRRR